MDRILSLKRLAIAYHPNPSERAGSAVIRTHVLSIEG
jgi:hypothetical protein